MGSRVSELVTRKLTSEFRQGTETYGLGNLLSWILIPSWTCVRTVCNTAVLSVNSITTKHENGKKHLWTIREQGLVIVSRESRPDISVPADSKLHRRPTWGSRSAHWGRRGPRPCTAPTRRQSRQMWRWWASSLPSSSLPSRSWLSCLVSGAGRGCTPSYGLS